MWYGMFCWNKINDAWVMTVGASVLSSANEKINCSKACHEHDETISIHFHEKTYKIQNVNKQQNLIRRETKI